MPEPQRRRFPGWERFEACKAAGLLPVTAAAIFALRLCWLTFLPMAATLLIGYYLVPSLVGIGALCVLAYASCFVVGIALSIASDVMQFWSRDDIVRVYSQGIGFYRMALSRTSPAPRTDPGG